MSVVVEMQWPRCRCRKVLVEFACAVKSANQRLFKDMLVTETFVGAKGGVQFKGVFKRSQSKGGPCKFFVSRLDFLANLCQRAKNKWKNGHVLPALAHCGVCSLHMRAACTGSKLWYLQMCVCVRACGRACVLCLCACMYVYICSVTERNDL